MPTTTRAFLITHVIYPLLALIILSVAINVLDIDKFFADYLYQLQGNSWAWKGSWLAEEVFHKGGRTASLLLALVIFILLITSYCRITWRHHRKPLAYLMLAATGGSLLVSLFKSSLAVSCPWEFDRYGGDLDYTKVFEQLGLRNGRGCFPSGHASAGYAWIALYFFGIDSSSVLRWAGLALPLLAGVVFGLAQQLRGAHFISHDLWTLAVCWFYSLTLYLFMFRKTNKN